MYELKPFEKVNVPDGYVYVPACRVKGLHKKYPAYMMMNTKGNNNNKDGWILLEYTSWIQTHPAAILDFFFCIKKEYATWKK